MTSDASAAQAALPYASEWPDGDWDKLFDAVLARLRQAGSGPAADLLPTLRECTGVLDHLQDARVREGDWRERSRVELRAAQAALATARLELARAHADEQSGAITPFTTA